MSSYGGDVCLSSPVSAHATLHTTPFSPGRRVDGLKSAASTAQPRRFSAHKLANRYVASSRNSPRPQAHHAKSRYPRPSKSPRSTSSTAESVRPESPRVTLRQHAASRQISRHYGSRKARRTPTPCPAIDSITTSNATSPRSTHRAESADVNPGRISTRVVYRAQLAANFVDLALMYDNVAKYQNPDIAFLPTLDFSSPLLQAAVDTISFVGLGTAHNDERLIGEARIRYSNALQLLSAELRERGPERKAFHSVVTSIMLLRLCSLFDSLSMQGTAGVDQGWHWHLDAVQRYMRSCGPKDLLKTELDWSLFRGVRHYMFYFSIFKQSSSMFAEPEWLAITEARTQVDDGISLYSLRMHLPGLLLRVKRVHTAWATTRVGQATKDMAEEFDSLYTDLQWLRNALAQWMADHGELVSDDDLLDMRAEPGVKTDPRPFQLNLLRASLVYSSVPKAAQCTTCWMLCTTVDGAMSQLLSTRIAIQSNSALLQTALRTINHDAYVCVTNLARSVDWCSRADVAKFSTVGAFHLQFAKNFYAAAGCELEVAWCSAMEGILAGRAYINSDGMFPTLCKYLHKAITMSPPDIGNHER